ncbi:MAG: hypothetical protein SOT57_13865 [Eubacteriales bacterium]|nr:hypothetical protein [Eubacteriales bacterium]
MDLRSDLCKSGPGAQNARHVALGKATQSIRRFIGLKFGKNKPNCVEIERFLRKLCRTAGSGARRKWAKAGNRAEIVLRRAMSKKADRKRFFRRM